MAAVTYDSSVKANDITSQSTLTSGSMTIAGSNRHLLVCAFSGASVPVDPTAVKWGGSGGTALTKVASVAAFSVFWKASIWSLNSPTAQTSTIFSDWGGAQDEIFIIGISFNNVDSGTPLGTIVTKTTAWAAGIAVDANNKDDTQNCTTAVDDMMADFICVADAAGGSSTVSIQNGQTLRQLYGAGVPIGFEAMAGATLLATGTTTTSRWRINDPAGSSLDVWSMFAIPVKQAAGGGGAAANPKTLLLGVS